VKLNHHLLFLFVCIVFIIAAPSGAIGDVITKENADRLTLFETIESPQAVYSVAWFPENTVVVFGLADGSVLQAMLLSASVRLPSLTGGHTDAVSSVDVSSDGRWVFSGAMDGTVRAWESTSGVRQPASGLSTSAGDPFILSVAARPDSPNEIAYTGEDSIIHQRVWNAPVRPGPPSLAGHANFVFDVEYSPDGSLVATGGADGSVRVWSYLSGTQQSIDDTSHIERVYDIAFTRDGRSLVSTGQDRLVMMRPVLSPGEPFRIAEIPDLTGDTVVNTVDVGLNGDVVAVGDSNGILRIYSVPSPDDIVSRLLIEMDAHDDQIRDLAISPDGTMIATAGFDRTLKIWNVPALGVPPSLPTATTPPLPAPPAPLTGDFCPGAPSSRLEVGMRARVTFTDGTALRLRTTPGGSIITSMPEGTPFNLIGGPLCQEGFTWWNIELDDGTAGWSAEGDDENYFIEPLSSAAPPPAPAGGATVSGAVWHDICSNGGPGIPDFCVASSEGFPVADGLRSSVEPVIGGVTVQIGSGACPTTSAFAEFETGSDGVYQFFNLEAGTYCIFVNPSHVDNSLALIPGEWTFPSFFDPATGVAFHTVMLSTGSILTDVEFGWDYQFLP